MVEHIVLLKLRPETTEQQIQALTDALLQMADKISGVEDVSAGMNNSPEGKTQGFTYGFIVRFSNQEARDAYLPHPVHRQVAQEYLRPIVDDVLVFDYEH